MPNPQKLEIEFEKGFGSPPSHVLRAPGRVNLIGEHTDYNEGFVLPMAIDREAQIAVRSRPDHTVRMIALDFGGEQAQFELGAEGGDRMPGWSKYIRGVAWALQQRGIELTGADMMIQGDVPVGSGLSSSAALEVCAATAFQTLVGFSLGKVELALLCQKAENEFVGVQCGIMDQFISALAREGHALLIDCRDLSTRDVPLPEGAVIVVCDTMRRRGLVDSEYNTRRAECAQAVRLLASKLNRPVQALRDVSPVELEEFQSDLPSNVAKRARHIVSENARVLEAASAAQKGDLVTLGKLMDASHVSMRDDYQISCAELDTMVEIAKEQTGCFGARLTGAGFGGCTVNLVDERAVQDFLPAVAGQYRMRVGVDPQIYPCRASAGAGVVS